MQGESGSTRLGAGGKAGSVAVVVQGKPVEVTEKLMQQEVGELEIVNFPRRGRRMKVKAMRGQSGQELK